MKTHSYHRAEGNGPTGRQGGGSGSLSRPIRDPEGFSLIKAGRRFLLGLQQIWIAIRYHFFFRQLQLVRFQQKTWVRLSVLVLAFFYVLGKDGAVSLIGGLFSSSQGVGEELGMVHQVSRQAEDGAYFRNASVRQLEDTKVRAYIRRFYKISKLESQKFGIPASVLMAQAISESWAGEHPAAVEGNNHFGRPFSDRVYPSAWENWRAHSLWVARKYPELLQHGKDYKRWARALQKTDYRHQKRYSRTLVGIIEKYHLYTLDE
jgi:hypothetical protein